MEPPKASKRPVVPRAASKGSIGSSARGERRRLAQRACIGSGAAKDVTVAQARENRTSRPLTIVGLSPRSFTGATVGASADVFLPLSSQPLIVPRGDTSQLDDPEVWWLSVIGRINAGTGDEHARAALDVTLQQAVDASLSH